MFHIVNNYLLGKLDAGKRDCRPEPQQRIARSWRQAAPSLPAAL